MSFNNEPFSGVTVVNGIEEAISVSALGPGDELHVDGIRCKVFIEGDIYDEAKVVVEGIENTVIYSGMLHRRARVTTDGIDNKVLSMRAAQFLDEGSSRHIDRSQEQTASSIDTSDARSIDSRDTSKRELPQAKKALPAAEPTRHLEPTRKTPKWLQWLG